MSENRMLTVAARRFRHDFDFIDEPGTKHVSGVNAVRVETGRAPPDTVVDYQFGASSENWARRWVLNNNFYVMPWPREPEKRNPEHFRRTSIQYMGGNVKGVIARLTKAIVSHQLGGEISLMKAHDLEICRPGYWGSWIQAYFPTTVTDSSIAEVIGSHLPESEFDSRLVIGNSPCGPTFRGSFVPPTPPINNQIGLMRFLLPDIKGIVAFLSNWLAAKDCFIHSMGGSVCSGTALGAFLFYLPRGCTIQSLEAAAKTDKQMNFYHPTFEKLENLIVDGTEVDFRVRTIAPVRTICGIEGSVRKENVAIVPPRLMSIGSTSKGNCVYEWAGKMVALDEASLDIALRRMKTHLSSRKYMHLAEIGNPHASARGTLNKMVFDSLARKATSAFDVRQLLVV